MRVLFWIFVGFFKCDGMTGKSANPFQTVIFFFFVFLFFCLISGFEDALIILSLEFYLPYFPGSVLRKNRSRNESSNTEMWTDPSFPLH